jgi:1,4-alpha-glucan branching enzyme
MSLKKQYIKTNKFCKVTFKLTGDTVPKAAKVNLAGEFNNWNIDDIPMKKLKNGDFSVTINLEKGKEYQFKYVIDSFIWLNEIEADKYVTNEFISENSVVIV